jgi:hypothetical protein
MTLRRWVGAFLVAAVVGGGAAAGRAQGPEDLARELAELMVDDTLRRAVHEQVSELMIQSITASLQERLDRRLQESERSTLADIIRRFVTDTFPPSRTTELAAGVYARHFDEAELRELLRFQRLPVARRAARLAPLIAVETAQAIDEEIKRSPAVPRLIEDLQQEFPVLRAPQSP